jgi:DNA-binding transcriptional LysR family regulator
LPRAGACRGTSLAVTGRFLQSCLSMDLRQLEILQAIAETGSFTASGRKLHVSQSAISRQIALLEDELGEPLFLRVGRQVRMTPAAESLVQLGQRVFQDMRDTVGEITDHTRALRGTLRLAGGMTVCLYVFPPLLKYLKKVHPKVDVRLTVATAPHSLEEIRSGRVDAGLLTLPVEESELVTVPVMREELLLVMMPTHRLAKKATIVPHDLVSEPFVLFEAGSATRHVIDSFFFSEKIEPRIVMDTENVEIIKAMVKTGLGIGIVPYQSIAREVRAGQFFCARIEGHELVRETGWVYARASRVPRMIDELMAAFEEIRERLQLSPSPPSAGAKGHE